MGQSLTIPSRSALNADQKPHREQVLPTTQRYEVSRFFAISHALHG